MKLKYQVALQCVHRRTGFLFALVVPILLTGGSAAAAQRDEAGPAPSAGLSPAAECSQDVEVGINRELALANALIESGQLQEAQARLGSLLQRDPTNGRAMLNLGVSFQQMGQHARARELYLQVLGLPVGQLAAGELSQTGAGRSLHDLASHNLRSVSRLMQQEQTVREHATAATQTDVGVRGAVLGAAAPTAKPAPGAASVSGDPALWDQQVLAVVAAWREAWTGRRVADYLAYYLPDFTPGGLMSHAQWRETREKRLLGAQGIDIEFDGLRVHRLSGQMARVVFRQSYRNERYLDAGCKTLVLQQHEGSWKIRSEIFVKVPAEVRCQ